MKRSLLFILAALISACQNQHTESESSTQQEPEHKNMVEFDLQGHRGARGLFPENSIEGFIAAVDLQVNTLEMDVVITKDMQVVVSHEPWVNSVICWGLDDKPVA